MHPLRSLAAKAVVGGTIAAAAAFGLAACGSSSTKTTPANPASVTNPTTGSPTTPAQPAPTNPPSGGGVSY